MVIKQKHKDKQPDKDQGRESYVGLCCTLWLADTWDAPFTHGNLDCGLLGYQDLRFHILSWLGRWLLS